MERIELQSVYTLTDSQKLDRIISGFDSLQEQYNLIKQDHEVLLHECKQLRAENTRLRRTLQSMRINSDKDFHQYESLLQEIEDLNETVSQEKRVIEEYRVNLEAKNQQLAFVVEELEMEKAKVCPCWTCRFIAWMNKKKEE